MRPIIRTDSLVSKIDAEKIVPRQEPPLIEHKIDKKPQPNDEATKGLMLSVVSVHCEHRNRYHSQHVRLFCELEKQEDPWNDPENG